MYIYAYILHVAKGIFHRSSPHQPNSGSAIASMYRSHGVSAIGAPGKGDDRKPKQMLQTLARVSKKTRAVIGKSKATALPKPIDFENSRQLQIIVHQEEADRDELEGAADKVLMDKMIVEELEGAPGVAFMQLNIHRLPTRDLLIELARRQRRQWTESMQAHGAWSRLSACME